MPLPTSKREPNSKDEETPVMTDTPVAKNEFTVPNLDIRQEDEFPEGKTFRKLNNPFQAIVNEMARTGKPVSAPFANQDEVEWARGQFRAAANNIDKGAKTKVIVEGRGWRVHFALKEKTTKESNKSK